jgi:multiple sugar transport system substrate-binding protein
MRSSANKEPRCVLAKHAGTESEASARARRFFADSCWVLRVYCLLLLSACARDDARTELRFWAFGREGEVVAELARDFEKENPDIRVRVQQIPWIAAHEKLLTAYVGETSPDVAQLGNTWIPEFVALHSLEPLDRRIAASSIVKQADYFPGIWATNVLDSVTWGVPWYVDTRVLFYRKDLFDKAGIATPHTWDEWRTALEKVRQAGAKYGIFLPLNEWNPSVILGMQAGSSLLKENGTRGAFSDSAFRWAFEYYIGMYRAGLAPVIGNQQIANPFQEFERGLFAMWITGPWQLGEFANRLPPEMQDKWSTMPMPGPHGDSSGVSMAGGSSLVVFGSSKHKEAAWKLVEWMSQPTQQARFYHLSGDLPPTYSAWRDSSLANNPRAQAFRVQLDRVRPLPPVPEWEQIATMMIDYAERAARGSLSTEGALEALDADVDRLLEKRRWMLQRRAVAASSSAPRSSVTPARP